MADSGNEQDCPFCQRYERKEFDMESDTWPIISFEPLNPVTPGHRLFLPFRHTKTSNSLYVGDTMAEANRYGTRREEQFNLILNSGRDATQTIEHMHVHYIPRHPGDGLELPWTAQKEKH